MLARWPALFIQARTIERGVASEPPPQPMFSPIVHERRERVQPVRLMRVPKEAPALGVVGEVALGDHVAGVAGGGAAELAVELEGAQAVGAALLVEQAERRVVGGAAAHRGGSGVGAGATSGAQRRRGPRRAAETASRDDTTNERNDAWETSDDEGEASPNIPFGSPASSLIGALWLCGPASRRGCLFVGKEPLTKFLLRPRTCVGLLAELL